MLKFKLSDYDEIRRHGEETYPHECCGILLGTAEEGVRTVLTAIRCANTRTDSPHNRYHIDPRELLRAQREAQERGIDIVGFYIRIPIIRPAGRKPISTKLTGSAAPT